MQTRLILLILKTLARLSLSGLHRLGWALGRLFYLIPNRERRNALINLQLCFPELERPARQELLARSLEQTGRTLFEIAAVWFWPSERVQGLIRQVSGEEHLHRPQGQGLVVLSPHLGCWEIAGLYLASRGAVTSLYRPPRQAMLEPLIKQARERSGAQLVPTDAQGVRRLYRVLQSGGTTGILPDQQPDSDKGAVFAPLFGVPALTMLLVNRLVRKTGAKVVFCYAERLPHGAGFHIHYLPAAAEVAAEDPVTAARALNQGIEICVRRRPDQYQWTYKRFKDQPPGMPSPYHKHKRA
jgi:KDO2-lipid IV(A) lauroyltransferase